MAGRVRVRPLKVEFNIQKHYPAWREKADRRQEDLDEVRAVHAEFELDDADRDAFEERFGKGVLVSETISVSRKYSGQRIYDFRCKEEVAVSNVLSDLNIPAGIASEA